MKFEERRKERKDTVLKREKGKNSENERKRKGGERNEPELNETCS